MREKYRLSRKIGGSNLFSRAFAAHGHCLMFSGEPAVTNGPRERARRRRIQRPAEYSPDFLVSANDIAPGEAGAMANIDAHASMNYANSSVTGLPESTSLSGRSSGVFTSLFGLMPSE